MQLKPRFENYKILEKHPILTDDTGEVFSLTLIRATQKNSDSEIVTTSYEFWTVIGNRQVKWANKKVVSYPSNAVWDSLERKNKVKVQIKDILVEEVDSGLHYVFSKYRNKVKYGVRTTFKLKVILDD